MMTPQIAPMRKVLAMSIASEMWSSAQNARRITGVVFCAIMIATARVRVEATASLSFLSQLFFGGDT